VAPYASLSHAGISALRQIAGPRMVMECRNRPVRNPQRYLNHALLNPPSTETSIRCPVFDDRRAEHPTTHWNSREGSPALT
jgi:hypothetical protein